MAALQAGGAHVVLSVNDPLLPVLKSTVPAVPMIGLEQVPESFDYHISLMDLPAIFCAGPATIPASIPYLRADSRQAQTWRARIGVHGFKVGIAWQGRTRAGMGNRAFRLADFEPLSKFAGVRLISLQKNDGVEQLRDNGFPVEVLGDGFDEGSDAFIDTDVQILCQLQIWSRPQP